MPITSADIESWSTVCYGKEVALLDLCQEIQEKPKDFVLRRFANAPASFLIATKNEKGRMAPVLASHAFVIRHCTPLDSGNFVPSGLPFPKGVTERSRKTQPGHTVHVFLSCDLTLDPLFIDCVKVLEEWGGATREVNAQGKSRTSWNNLNDVEQECNYSMTSKLFRHRENPTPKEKMPEIPYEVHPWIERAASENWIPNPDLAQFYHLLENETMDAIKESEHPNLRPGDLVKIAFKVGFNATSSTYSMTFIPVQGIRVMLGDGYRQNFDYEQDEGDYGLPKPGQMVRNVPRSEGNWRRPTSEIPEAQKGRALRRSESWDTLSPPPEDSETESDGEIVPIPTRIVLDEDENQNMKSEGSEDVDDILPKKNKGKGRQIPATKVGNNTDLVAKAAGVKRKKEDELEKKKRVMKPRNQR